MIEKVYYCDIAHLVKDAERALKLKVLPRIDFWAYYVDGVAVGFVSVLLYEKKAKLHSSYVVPEHRGKGYYSKLNERRLAYIKSLGIRKIEANCTKDSLAFHLKRGAVAGKVYAICTQITYEL